MERLKINLIGPGKVGLTILRRIAMTGACTVQDIAGRSIEKAEAAVAFVGAGAAVRSVADMRQADLWLLTVPDSQVATAAAELAATPTASDTPSVAVHCSGFLPADEMKPLRALGWQLASLHPVLTFAEPAKAVSHFDGVSCGMEGDAGALALVEPLVTEIGGMPFGIRSEAKAIYHAAAVFSSNFNVVLQAIAREAWAKAGVPDDVFANLFLDHQTTSALIAAGNFNFINFTGSVEGGRSIERAAAGTFSGLGLELGGKDPGYVMEDADLDAAVDTLMDGATFNSGQCCCGIERIYVNEKLYDAFVEKSVAWVSNYKLGNPLDPQTTLGPMANKRFAKVVREQIADAVAKGAKALVDPKLFPADDGGAYLAPQVLVDVDHSMEFMREETFGPAVGIMKVKSDEEALALMNDSKYGLTASLWTQDPERAARIGREIETGTVFMNRADYLDPALVWTGCKDTGRGGSLSVIGFHNLTRPKSYHLKKVTA